MSCTISSALDGLSIGDDAAPASASTRFPNEVVENIAHLTTDPATLASWMSVSRTMYNIVAPRLYQEGVVTRNGSLYVGCEGEVDEPIESVAGLFESDEGFQDQSTIIALLYSKTQLLAMIRRLYVHELPSPDVYKEHIALLVRNKAAGKSFPVTVSMRPRAVGQVMTSTVDRLVNHHSATRVSRKSADFVRYLSHFDIDHLCVQLPTMDQDIEDSLVPNRKMPRNFLQIEYPRRWFRYLLVSGTDGRFDEFFYLFQSACQTLTIHNMTLRLYNRAFNSVSRQIPTVRTFFRPCTNADADLVDKVFDRYCYNHLDDGTPHINDSGNISLGDKILHSPRNLEFIDIDWRRGRYDPNRSDETSKSLSRQIKMQVEEALPLYGTWIPGGPPLVRRLGGCKSVKMSREVEAWKCCGRHQLSAVESSISYTAPK